MHCQTKHNINIWNVANVLNLKQISAAEEKREKGDF